jgi:hypothetical protein
MGAGSGWEAEAGEAKAGEAEAGEAESEPRGARRIEMQEIIFGYYLTS